MANISLNVGATSVNASLMTPTNIKDGSVTTDKLADGAVTTVKLADGSVTTEKLGEDVRGQISDLKSDFNELADDIFAKVNITVTKSIATQFDVVKLGYNLNPPGATKLVLAPHASYNSYYFEVSEDFKLYFGDLSSLTYIALGVVKNVNDIYTDSANQIHFVGTSAARYRKSDNNMPTTASPITLNNGDMCIVTVPTGTDVSNVPVYLIKENVRSSTILNNNIILNENQVKQICNKGYLQYISGSGNDSSTERLNIYIPTHSGYIKYEFLHSVYNNNNCNVWRMGRASHVDDNFAELTQLTTNGEWECAIKLQNRSDFAGGYNHGNEVYTSMTVYIDGKAIDITALTDMISFEDIKIIQHSNLYDPDDSTTIFAEHGSCHKFSIKGNNNLEIEQGIKWLGSYIAMPSYLAMFPPLKITTDKIYNDVSFVAETIVLPQTISNVRNVTLSKDSLNFSCNFGIEKYPDVDNLSGTFFITDNGGQAYNKCYYFACGNDASVASGAVWKSKTIYNLEVGVL